MNTNLVKSFFNGCEEYFDKEKYILLQLGGRIALGLSTTECVQAFAASCEGFTDTSDGTDVVALSFGFLSGKTIDKLFLDESCSRYEKVMITSKIALIVLSATAFAGAIKVIDLGKIAMQMGSVTILGIKPGVYLVNFGLIPSIRVVYLSLLIMDIGRLLHERLTVEKVEQTCMLTADVRTKEALAKYNRIRRECLFNAGKGAACAVYQVVCLAALTTIPVSVPVLMAVGIISSLTGITANVLQTDSMRQYFWSDYKTVEIG